MLAKKQYLVMLVVLNAMKTIKKELLKGKKKLTGIFFVRYSFCQETVKIGFSFQKFKCTWNANFQY